MDDIREATPHDLLGPLNAIEQKFAPEILYYAGEKDFLQRGARISIVGSRKASPEGIARARKLAKSLAARDMVVVSGLAEGIDTAAHTACVNVKGRTLAVIGTPLNKAYPKKNESLQRELMREHLVISQFPIGHATKPHCFILRNRTMALISDATVIIEASDTSGSLSQGWETLRLGRSLFMTKSVAENPNLTWPSKMMHYGAQVLSDETFEQFVESLPIRDPQLAHDAISF